QESHLGQDGSYIGECDGHFSHTHTHTHTHQHRDRERARERERERDHFLCHKYTQASQQHTTNTHKHHNNTQINPPSVNTTQHRAHTIIIYIDLKKRTKKPTEYR